MSISASLNPTRYQLDAFLTFDVARSFVQVKLFDEGYWRVDITRTTDESTDGELWYSVHGTATDKDGNDVTFVWHVWTEFKDDGSYCVDGECQ